MFDLLCIYMPAIDSSLCVIAGTVALWLVQTVVPGLIDTIPRHADERLSAEDAIVQKLMEDRKAVRSVEFSVDGRVLASGGDDGTVQLRLTEEIGKTATPPVIAGTLGDPAVLSMVWSEHCRGGNTMRRSSTLSLLAGNAEGEVARYAVSVTRLQSGVSLADPVPLQRWAAHEKGCAVRALAVSPRVQVQSNGDVEFVMASASDDRLLKLWRIDSTPAIPSAAVTSAAGALAALAEEPSEILPADDAEDVPPPGVERLAILEGHTGPVYSCCFHPGGHTLASGSEDEQVRLWNASPGKPYGITQVLDVDRGTQQEEVMGLCYSPDGGYLVTGQSDHAVHLWEPRLFPTQAAVDEAAMDSFDSQDVAIRLANAGDTISVDVSPDGMYVLAASGRNATVWSVESNNPLEPAEHLADVSCASFSPDGTMIVTGSNDEVVRVWTVHGELVKVFAARFELVQGKLRAPGEVFSKRKVETGDRKVRGVAWSTAGTRVAAACWDRMVRVWDVSSAALLCTLHGHAHCPTAVVFAPGDEEIIAAGDDGTVRVWEAPPARVDETAELAASYPRSAGSAPKSRGSHTLAIVLPPKVSMSEAVTGGKLKSLCCTNNVVAAGSEDGNVYLWSRGSYAPLGSLYCPASSTIPLCSPAKSDTSFVLGSAGVPLPSVTSVASSPDGALIAATYADRWLRIWQVATGVAVGAMRMPRVCAGVAFSGDRANPRLAVACGSELRWYDIFAWQGLSAHYPGLMEHVYQPLPVVTKTQVRFSASTMYCNLCSGPFTESLTD